MEALNVAAVVARSSDLLEPGLGLVRTARFTRRAVGKRLVASELNMCAHAHRRHDCLRNLLRLQGCDQALGRRNYSICLSCSQFTSRPLPPEARVGPGRALHVAGMCTAQSMCCTRCNSGSHFAVMSGTV